VGHGDGVDRRDLENLEVFNLGLFILAGGKVLVGAGEVAVFLGCFGTAAAGERDRKERKDGRGAIEEARHEKTPGA
jgi:hypothetical protein